MTTTPNPPSSTRPINPKTERFNTAWLKWFESLYAKVGGSSGSNVVEDGDFTSQGFMTSDGAGTYTMRTLTGTSDEIDIANGDGSGGAPTIGLSDNVILPGTGAITVPRGTTAQRPGTPVEGMLRYNTTTSRFEGYEDGEWINISHQYWDD